MNYASIAKTAQKLIKDAGKPITLIRSTAPEDEDAFDPITGLSEEGEPQSFIGSGVLTEFDYHTTEQAMALEATKRLLCVGIPAPVPSSDRLEVDGSTYLVVRSQPLAPGSVTLLYDIWVK